MRANETNEKNLDEFHTIGLKTLKRSLKTENDSLIARIHESLASWHAYNGMFSPDSVVYHAEKALAYHLKGNDKKKIADTYRSLSIDYLNSGQLDKEEVLFKAIKLYEDLNDYAGKALNYSELSIAQFNLIIGYGELGEYEKTYAATQYCLEIVRTKGPEEIFIPVRAYSYRDDVCITAKDYENALKDYMAGWEYV